MPRQKSWPHPSSTLPPVPCPRESCSRSTANPPSQIRRYNDTPISPEIAKPRSPRPQTTSRGRTDDKTAAGTLFSPHGGSRLERLHSVLESWPSELGSVWLAFY